MNRKPVCQGGFTLLEVLVALAVAAIALGAIIKVTAESANSTAYLRDRTLASWVALNQVNQLLLNPDWPKDDSAKSGKTTMADREWRWELRVSETSDKDLRRLEVTVRSRDGAEPLATLIAFKSRRSKDSKEMSNDSKETSPSEDENKGKSQ
jgi:general secretion pathway protein I